MTTTSVVRPVEDVGSLPGPFARVVAGPTGVLVTTASGELPPRRVTDVPAELAFGVGAGRLVYQHASEDGRGPITVLDADGSRELLPMADYVANGGGMTLLDAGTVDDRPVAVIETHEGANPESWDVRLLVIDLGTGERRDLGSVGGWEEGVAAARLLPDGDIVVFTVHLAGGSVHRRSPTGGTRWEIPDAVEDDANVTMTVAEDSVLLIDTGPGTDRATPAIRLRAFDLVSGAPASDYFAEPGAPAFRTLVLEDDLSIEAGYCAYAEAVALSLLCDQSSGPTVRVDVATGTTHRETGAPDEGTMTFWRD